MRRVPAGLPDVTFDVWRRGAGWTRRNCEKYDEILDAKQETNRFEE